MPKKYSDISVAVIIALAEEYQQFVRYYDGLLVEKIFIGDVEVGIFESSDKSRRFGVATIHRMGNVAAAVTAARLSEAFDLSVVINIGLAAGVNREKQNLGDIIIAENILYAEAGKLGEAGFRQSLDFINVMSSFIKNIQVSDIDHWALGSSVGGHPRKIHFGSIASVDKVISSKKYVDDLLIMDRKIVGIEMESYGIAAALHGRQEKFIEIRGISDFADATKDDSARLSAIEGATRFFNEAMRRGLFHQESTKVASSVEGRASSEIGVDSTRKYMIDVIDMSIVSGVSNTHLSMHRSDAADRFKYRKSVIERLSESRSLEEIRIFCIELGIDYDDIYGATKKAKAAGIVEFLERKKLMTIEDLDIIIGNVS